MPVEEFELLEESELERLLCWRLRSLLEAGYSSADALILATHLEVDLEQARSLVRCGCQAKTAVRILL
jgi:hypothetical protein